MYSKSLLPASISTYFSNSRQAKIYNLKKDVTPFSDFEDQNISIFHLKTDILRKMFPSVLD